MRILHLIKKFNFGGAENHVRDLANVTQEMGNEVFVISRKGKQNELLSKHVRFFPFYMHDGLLLFQVPYLIYIIRKYKIQVLHAHQRLPVLLASFAGKLTGIPVVVTIHGQTQHDLRSPFARKIPAKFIYVRQSTLDESPEYGIPASKSVFIQNGVAIRNISDSRDYSSVCYVSRIDKRHASVISLIIRKVIVPVSTLYKDMTFNIVGDGDSLDYLRDEAELINNEVGRKAIIIHGYVADVKEIIMKSGLILGVGRVAIESLACGVPVLSVNYKCLGGLVSKDNYLYMRMNNFVSLRNDPPDDTKLISFFREYFEKPLFWQEEAVFLQNEIDKDFNIYKIGKNITDVYNEVIEMTRNK
jgi:glycosyltransferase involved in cell wall biosynthesis